MSQIKFEQSGVDAIAAGVVATGNTHKARIIDLSATSNLNKAITGTSQLTGPLRLTITSHGWSVGDILVIQGVGGTAGANGTYRIKTVVDANTVEVQTLAAQGETALDVIGSGAYTSGGRAFNVSRPAANSTSTDIPAAAGSSTDQTYTASCTKRIWTGTIPQFPSVAASTLIGGLVLFQSAPTDRAVSLIDGKQLVRLTATTTAGTTLNVEPLYAGIPNGTALVFSNGVTATLTAVANAGDTTLTVGSVTIPKGHTADAPITGANLPVTTASGSAGTYTYTVDPTFGHFTL